MKNKQFEKWAMPIILKAAKVLLVEDFYPVRLEWKKDIDGSESAIAGFNFTHPYKTLEIHYTDDLVKDWKENGQGKNVLVHEICHALTDPLFNAGFQRFVTKDQLSDEREKLTDHIANIVLKNKLI